MRGSGWGWRHCKAAAPAALCALTLALAGCSSAQSVFGTPRDATTSPGGSFTDRVKNLFGRDETEKGPVQASTDFAQNDIDCPQVTFREGAASLTATATGRDPNAGAVRYQLSLRHTARECAILGATLTMKVGVEGRVILGPAGAPGRVEAPIRLALVREGPHPVTVWTKFYRVPVDVPPGNTNVPFIHVEEDLTVPVPSPSDLEAYVVYAGFDATAHEVKPKPTHRRARKPKKKK